MNSESPFRTSSMVLTIACVLCGITAAAFCVSQFSPPRTVHESSDVAAHLHFLNYAEFQKNVRSGHEHREPAFDAVQRSDSIPEANSLLRKSSECESSETRHARSSRRGDSSTPDRGQELVRSTGFSRSASAPSPPVDAPPHFYAPVTVHPVTVNIDNSAIIREIARLHERLDSIPVHSHAGEVIETSEVAAPESVLPFQFEVPSSTRRFEYIVHNAKQAVASETVRDVVQDTDATGISGKSSGFRSQSDAAFQPESVRQPKSVPQRLPARASAVRHPPKNSESSAFVVPRQHSERIPAAVPILSFPEAVSGPTPEPTIEIIPQQPEPVSEFEDPSTVLPQTELPMIVPSIEFSTELIPVPESTSNSEQRVLQDVSGESPPAAPAVERTAHCAPVKPFRRSVSPLGHEHLGLEHLTSCFETAKRTTNPPFMNGVERGIPLSPQLATPEPRSQVTPVSHQVREKRTDVPRPKGTLSEMPPTEAPGPGCRVCNAHGTSAPAHSIRAVTPPPILKRLASLIRQDSAAK